MTPIIMRRLWAAGFLLGCVAPAWAVYPPPVKDDGKFFKPETLEKANKKIRDIYRDDYTDVVVETFSTVPAELEKKLQEGNKSEEGKGTGARRRFFREWAERRRDELGVHGLYILLVRKPGHMQVTEDQRTRERRFTVKDRNKLVQTVLGLFKEEKFDEGLLQGLDFVESTLKAHSKK